MKKIIISITLLMLISCYFLIVLSGRKQAKITDEQKIDICTAEFETINSKIDTYGTVGYKTKHDITSTVAGNVIEKKVKEGDYVKRNQVLYVLKNIEMEIQSAQYENNLISAKANLDLYKAKLTEQKQLTQSRLLSLKNKEAEISQLKSDLKSAENKYIQNIELNKLGGITDQNLKDMEDRINSIKTDLEIKEREYEISAIGFTKDDLIKNGIIPSENHAIFEQQLISLNTKTSEAELSVAKSEYENAVKNVQLINKLLDDLTIRACTDGVIGVTNFETGEFINQNEKILTIIDISICTAEINIQENDIFKISPGNIAIIEIPSAEKTFSCPITEISPVADYSTGNFFVKADFKNENMFIKPGMFLKCCIPEKETCSYLKIPETALINSTGKTAECFIVADNLAVHKKLDIEFTRDGFAYFKTGLETGQKVINNPSRKIKDGTNVKIL
ncbi:MAG: efflux RND transporter periplasmic adaptor subunit [Treponema sp.]|uniref:efflux RND transporter periplasmic adaptor subunit n=1 Tax=Treponema sp. TaxID=166 RepID=UPI00298D7994|nr:efflux RND transporter periplasmic adaptor subunit [Treponema sp.]MBR5933928.1 efflux RND transporter periplasmic adaptor subunit [Treponema sp.]